MDEIVEIYKREQHQKCFESVTSGPLLKWAGGKKMVLPFIVPRFLNTKMLMDGNTYIEPFLGSGCVAMSLNFPRMILSDKNIKLMNFHEQVKQRPDKLYRKIMKYVDRYALCKTIEEQEKFYYEARKKYNSLILTKGNGILHASLFWFLNKTGFNGMYRETKSGDFNIPFGKRDCPIPSLNHFKIVSSILHNSDLLHKPFDAVCEMSKKGDIVYLDPPYIPISKTSSFSSYLRYGFDENDHKKLCRIMNDLSSMGVYVVMSNSNCSATMEIYGKLKGFVFTEVETQRFISGKSSGRKKITELVISNQL